MNVKDINIWKEHIDNKVLPKEKTLSRVVLNTAEQGCFHYNNLIIDGQTLRNILARIDPLLLKKMDHVFYEKFGNYICVDTLRRDILMDIMKKHDLYDYVSKCFTGEELNLSFLNERIRAESILIKEVEFIVFTYENDLIKNRKGCFE